jgi:hypothetical protein
MLNPIDKYDILPLLRKTLGESFAQYGKVPRFVDHLAF